MTHVVAERSAGWKRTPALLRESAFRRYWGAQTISLFGDQISSIALPLSAVLVLRASSSQMEYALAAGTLAGLLGLRATLWIAAGGAMLGFLWLMPPAVRRLRF
jgi:type IV secretory pathway TrbD component